MVSPRTPKKSILKPTGQDDEIRRPLKVTEEQVVDQVLKNITAAVSAANQNDPNIAVEMLIRFRDYSSEAIAYLRETYGLKITIQQLFPDEEMAESGTESVIGDANPLDDSIEEDNSNDSSYRNEGEDEDRDDSDNSDDSDDSEDSDEDNNENPEDETVISKTTKKITYKTLREMEEARLSRPKCAVSQTLTAEKVEDHMKGFFYAILDEEYYILKDNKRVLAPLAVEDARKLTEYIFVEMFGKQVVTRLSDLVNFPKLTDDNKKDCLVGNRAAQLAEDSSLPELLQEFILYSSKAKLTIRKDDDPLSSCRDTVNGVNTLNALNVLKEQARYRDPELMAMLEQKVGVGRGISTQSRLLTMLVQELGLQSRYHLNNFTSTFVFPLILAQTFGSLGVVALMPPNTLNSIGTQRLQRIGEILANFSHPYVNFVRMVDTHILQPVLQNRRLIINLTLAQKKATSLEDVIRKAIEMDPA